MKMAIIMQCHRDHNQVNRIINFFDDKDIDIYIHVDKKSDIKSKLIQGNNVHILQKSIDVRWARYSQVEATINLMKEVRNSGKIYKYIHFISGQDYPVKSLKYMKEFFNFTSKQYVEWYKFPENSLVKNGDDRYMVYYPQAIIDRPKCLWKRILRVSYRNLILGSKILKRNIKNMPEFYGGSSWFSITGECMEYILEFINKNRDFEKFFKNSIYADEMFFQTIILNSKYKKQVINDNLRYLDWTEGRESPKSLDESDIDKAIKSKKIFARKIENDRVIDYIETIHRVDKYNK